MGASFPESVDVTATAYTVLRRYINHCWNTTNRAIAAGDLVRQPCSQCGTNENIYAHHLDYDLPLDVIWLCSSCHKNEHLRIAPLLPRKGEEKDGTCV